MQQYKIPVKYQTLMALNPLTTIVETIKFGFLGVGGVPGVNYLISISVSIVVFVVGAAVFKRTERRFVDTV